MMKTWWYNATRALVFGAGITLIIKAYEETGFWEIMFLWLIGVFVLFVGISME